MGKCLYPGVTTDTVVMVRPLAGHRGYLTNPYLMTFISFRNPGDFQTNRIPGSECSTRKGTSATSDQ